MGTQSGKLLDVDLSAGEVSERAIDEGVLRDYVGGSGLAAKLFVDDDVPVDCDPLGPDNNLYLITGPFTGTGFPASSRYGAAAKSPLTGIWLARYSSRFSVMLVVVSCTVAPCSRVQSWMRSRKNFIADS